ncbi:MAG: O-methyltransferase [Ignavibacteriales bacterium]|nr:O-methyltransferase [Ignavibacteriales bacterium]
MFGILKKNTIKYLSKTRIPQDELILKMEELARRKNIPILNYKAAEFLEQLVLIKKPKKVLEIGTAIAYTSIRIARKLSSDDIIDTIELSKDNIKIAKNFIQESGLNNINLIEGNAFNVIPKLGHKYDIVFMDADKEDYIEQFNLSLNLLNTEGVIVIDNLLWYGFVATKKVPEMYRNSTKHVKEFNKLFLSETSLYSTILPIGDGIGLGIKK